MAPLYRHSTWKRETPTEQPPAPKAAEKEEAPKTPMAEHKRNGTADVGDMNIPWAPIVAPVTPPPPEKRTRVDDPDECSTGFWSDLFAWWRSKRERKFVAKIRRLKMELAYQKEENNRLAEMVENMRRWTLASTAAAERVAAQFGAPAQAPETKRRGQVIP